MLALGAELFARVNEALEDNDRNSLVFGEGGMVLTQIHSLEK